MKKEFFCLFDSVPKLLAPLFDSCDTPWELLSRLSDYLIEITKNPPKGYSLLKNSGGSSTSPSCGGSISACPRHSGIMIGEGVRIEDYVTILPPAVIFVVAVSQVSPRCKEEMASPSVPSGNRASCSCSTA